MKRLFTTTLLTVAAVPFLMAAPSATKAQNTATPSTQSKAKTKKASKKHKSQSAKPATDTSAKK